VLSFSLLDRHGAFVFDSASYSELRLGDHTTIDFGNSFLDFFSFDFWKLEFIAIMGPRWWLEFCTGGVYMTNKNCG